MNWSSEYPVSGNHVYEVGCVFANGVASVWIPQLSMTVREQTGMRF